MQNLMILKRHILLFKEPCQNAQEISLLKLFTSNVVRM